jgi:hypothetical protein
MCCGLLISAVCPTLQPALALPTKQGRSPVDTRSWQSASSSFCSPCGTCCFSPNICSSLPLPGSGAICGAGALSAEATNSRKKKAPAVGAGGRARPGPKFAERIVHRPPFALHVGEMLEEERAISLSHIIGPIPLSRSDPLPGICSMTPEICSMRPSRWGVLSSTSGQSELAP